MLDFNVPFAKAAAKLFRQDVLNRGNAILKRAKNPFSDTGDNLLFKGVIYI
jgi:hypothetical protein